MKSNRWFSRLIYVACVCMALSAGVAIGSDGVVVDKESGKPLEGVFVIAKWFGAAPNPVQASTICLHGEMTITDKQGRFTISSTSGNFNPLIGNRRRTVEVYKPGYQDSIETNFEELRFVIEPNRAAPADRFNEVFSTSAPPGCGMDRRDALPFLRARVLELEPLATTREQQRDLIRAYFDAEYAEFGEQEAMKRSGERMRKWQSDVRSK